jgi:hypothetical protein
MELEETDKIEFELYVYNVLRRVWFLFEWYGLDAYFFPFVKMVFSYGSK